ncbi:glycosyl transferase, family 14 protein, partial [Tanacetum coccineum]
NMSLLSLFNIYVSARPGASKGVLKRSHLQNSSTSWIGEPGGLGRSESARNILGNEKLRLDLESEKKRSHALEENMKGHEGRFSVHIHASREKPVHSSRYFLNREIRSGKMDWGKFSMVDAEKQLLANALKDPDNCHFVLLSDSFEEPGPHGRKNFQERNESFTVCAFPARTNSWIPERLVPGDTNPGRLVARDKLKGKARRGFFPGRDTPATLPGPHSFSQTMKCHGGGFSRATCRPGLCCY